MNSLRLISRFNKHQLVPKTSAYFSRCAITTSSVTQEKAIENEDFWAKNKRLNRPISPHMTIYKPQITSILSLSHRATGIMLSAAVSSFSIGMLAASSSFPHYLEGIQAMHYGGSIIFGAKFLIAFPFIFHLCNGVRHLMWDLGLGFSLRTLYKTGYGVLGASLILSLLVSAL